MAHADQNGSDGEARHGSNHESSDPEDEQRENTQILLRRAQNGSNAVWQVFYDRYREFLVYHIRIKMPVFARRQFDAEDILQSAFTAAWKNIVSFKYQGEGSFRRYLRQIVYNRFLNELKKAESQGRHFSTDDGNLPLQHGGNSETTSLDPAAIYSREEFRDHALAKLAEMDEEDQEIIGMRFYEAMTWTDMGEVLGCDRETAKERFLRALKRLQRALDEGLDN